MIDTETFRSGQAETKADVVQLLDGGAPAVAAKVREESEELIEAAASQDAVHIAHEAADLLFHVLVLLAHSGVGAEGISIIGSCRLRATT